MNKIRAKMILIVCLSVLSVFAVMLVIMNVALERRNITQADGMTQIISMYNGVVPEVQGNDQFDKEDVENQIIYNAETAFKTRYFVVYFNEDMEVETVNIEHVASIDEDTACTMAETVVSEGDTVGYIDEYRFRITKSDNEVKFVIFLDCSDDFASHSSTIMILLVILLAMAVFIIVLFAIFSSRILKPFEENSRRHKQFITDASHELKTPLAIISANAEVLAYKNGKNEWTENITEQIGHMRDLIDELLVMSKMEELQDDMEYEAVNLSEALKKTLGDFDEVISNKNVSVETDIADDIVIDGNKKMIGKLAAILIENSSKYVTDAGIIRVSLNMSGDDAQLKIFNTAQLSGNLNLNKLFQRFYRPDDSRTSKTGGHGVGLSIAKKIVNLHDGSIYAKQGDGGICFMIKLPRRAGKKKIKKTKK